MMDDWVTAPAVPEKFDKSWGWNYKWCFNGYTNEAHVWRIPNDDDGTRTHRPEAEVLLGRPLKVTEKDALGRATYVPAEMKYDGTVVAPPHVLVEAYYGMPVPDAVHAKLEEEFPDAVVRNARVSSVLNPTLPKPKPKKLTDEFEEPEKDVDDPELRSDFSTDPKYHLKTHEAAARWAQDALGPEMPSSEGWVKKLLSWPLRSSQGRLAASEADHEGAMIALYVPKEIGKKIQVKGGEPLEDLHITLAYFVDKGADRDDWDDLKKVIEPLARQHGAITGSIGGSGVFNNDVDVLYASVDAPGINELRHEIVEAAEDAGFQVSKEHSFTPHVTLQYDHKGKLPKRDPIDVSFDSLYIVIAGEKESFKFIGSGFSKEITTAM